MSLQGGWPQSTKQGEVHFKAIAKEGTFIRREKKRSIKESIIRNVKSNISTRLSAHYFGKIQKNLKSNDKLRK